ncbi:hypothetical protein IZU94_16370 [Legionella sp. 27fs60]|uniref:Transporter n=1 Tax=Legionella bononiensis TaxID=2793102 RepID=A0ABS1WFF7_9GAMM|nr:hypothetical protein [Legionella bononiensis]MBL7528085.1 hypothetical protein [Legionella bononiensis]MBL7562561.1 hypothetical protein [Legionella bononiensis]
MSLYLGYLPSIYANKSQPTINYSTGLGTPITTATTDTSDKGGWGVSQRAEYFSYKPFSDLELMQNPEAESQNAYFINYLMINYGLTNNITVGAILPYVYSSNLRAASLDESSMVSQLGNISGVSDTNLFSVWKLVEEDKSPISMALLTGINAPTGKTSVLDNEGVFFAASDQPGSGAWSPFAGLIFTKKWDRFLLSSNLIYTQYTEGSQNTTLGSIVNYNFAAVIDLYDNPNKNKPFQLDGILEINGEYNYDTIIDGISEPNSSSSSIFLTPGLRANFGSAVSIYFGANLPLMEYYHGISAKTNYSFIGGVDISL